MIDWKSECKVERIYLQTGTTKFPGGQQAGVPSSLIKITHIPTSTMAQFGEERSQFKNKEIAFEMIEWALIKAKII